MVRERYTDQSWNPSDRRATLFFLWHPGDDFEPRCLLSGHTGELGVQGKDKQEERADKTGGGVPYYEETRGTKSSMRSSVDRCKARQAPRSFVHSFVSRLPDSV